MKKITISPFAKILFTFVAVILIGAIFLTLPISSTSGRLSFVDSLFMSTSSVCVTGLSVVSNISVELTFFGQLIMAILMFIGGLGFLTISTFFLVVIGAKIGVSDRFLIREVWNMDTSKGIIKLVRNIVLTALGIQVFGMIINYFILMEYFGAGGAVWKSIFHSISAFNNVGFDILGNSNSMINYSGNVLLNLSTMMLIVLGGLGFVTIFDMFKNRLWSKFSLTTKVVILATPILIVVGGLLLKFCMWDHLTWLQAFFTSVASRTAGFATFDLSTLSSSAYIILIVLMFIGGSPCSAAGGIKTTTFVVILASTVKFASNKNPVIFKRTLPNKTIRKAFSLFSLSIVYILFATFMVSIFESGVEVQRILFEVVSAFGTVGYSMGLTTSLSVASKLVIIFTMFFGRIGTLTIMNFSNTKWLNNDINEIEYVEEKIIVG